MVEAKLDRSIFLTLQEERARVQVRLLGVPLQPDGPRAHPAIIGQPADMRSWVPRRPSTLSDWEALGDEIVNWLGLQSYDGPGGQGGDYPEGQIYQQKINCKHRPLVQPEISRAAHRQKEQE